MTPDQVKDIFVNNKNDVPYGAGASNTPSGFPVNIDSHVPQFNPKLLDKTGKPADIWKYTIIHEIEEYQGMKRDIAAKEKELGRKLTDEELQKIYLFNHVEIATKKEKEAVEADGVDWNEYEKIWDGHLATIERENPKNPPPNLYLKPYPHHKMEELERNISKKKQPKLTPVEHNPFEQEQQEHKTIYRGEYTGNKGGKFWSEDKEFAKQFTQSGREEELLNRTIHPDHIYPATHIYAGDPDAIDKMIEEIKPKGFKALELNEGQGEPNSIYVFDKTALKPGKPKPKEPTDFRSKKIV